MMLAGRVFGIILFVIGVPITTLLINWIITATHLPRIVIIGPTLTALGLAMALFPGGQITISELADKEKPDTLIWSDAPLTHKVIWVISTSSALFYTFYLMSENSVMPL